jgi:uncharacterized protein (DUF2132 family)
MSGKWANKHLHGVKLADIVTALVKHYSWAGLAEVVNINCFKKNPSVTSSVKFLLKTPWALENVQDLYVALQTAAPVAEISETIQSRTPSRTRPIKPVVMNETADADPNDPWAKARKKSNKKSTPSD